MEIKLLLQKMLLQDKERPDSRLADLLRSCKVDLKDYYPCRVNLFHPDEIGEVANHIASFGNELMVKGKDRIQGCPTEGVFAFKRNSAFKYVQYVVPEGFQKTVLEYVLIPTSEKNKDAFVEYLVKEVAEFEHNRRKSKSKERDYSGRLFLSPSVKETLINHVELFLEGRDFYIKHRLPWKLGILLYGPPGNGKSLFIKAVSEYFDLELRDLSRQIHMGRIYLEEAEKSEYGGSNFLGRYECYTMVYNDPKPRIYYFEDIDKRVPSGSGDIPDLPVNELLQTLDGVVEIENVIMIATTNHMQNLIRAIVARPGRFDVVQEIGMPEESQIKAMLDYYEFKVDDDAVLLKELSGNSMAFVENFVKLCIMTYKKTEFKMSEIKEILAKIRDHAKLEEQTRKSYEGWGKP